MQTIYYGGDIITMEGESPEAVLVEDGIICKLGSKSQLRALMDKGAVEVDLKGKTLLPSFVDPHSHITALSATMGSVDLTGVSNFSELLSRIQSYAMSASLTPGQWITAFGYDHNTMEEKRHPDKFVLDQLNLDHPIVATHASGHMGAVNSAALKELGICASSENPAGGMIGRIESSQEPNGYLEEAAFTSISNKIPAPGAQQLLNQLDLAQDIYLKNGITTIQDGLTRQNEWSLLQKMAQQNRLKADVVSYFDLKESHELFDQNRSFWNTYHNRLKLGGYKIFLDGSPQGRTAWMSRPYENAPDGYCGYPIYDDLQVLDFIKIAVSKQVQLLAHCNGDAACAQLIKCCRQASNGVPLSIRPVMIHAQLLQPEQLADMAKLNLIASFFIAHIYHWGDTHIQNFGMERASQISPVGAAIQEGVTYTFHQDTPVIAPNMMDTIWCAVNRKTRNGIELGAEQKISVYDALKAITIHGAYQYFEEDKKGSIREGKLADLVILDQNPLKVNPMDLRYIQVVCTIKNGDILFQQ